jgi:hypothetical protein
MPTTTPLSDVLKVALGALLAIGTRWIDEIRTRRQRRRSIATALLDEARAIEVDMRRLTTHREAARRGGASATGILRRIVESDDLFLFRSSTISLLLNRHGLLLDIQEAIADFRSSNGTEDWLHGTVRAKAFFVADGMREVKKALLAEGGSLPPASALQTVDPEHLPALPPSAFPEWETKRNR